jgi:LexA-binding, inner membrane-associated putative hydrolase
MPGFKIHITASTALGIGYGGAAFALYDVPAPTAALAAVLCSVSGMLPDLDSGPGRPLHESVSFAAAAVPMMMADRFKHLGWTHESMILAGAMIYILIRFVLGHMLKKWCVHRGIFHSFPVALIFAEIGFLVCTSGDLNMRYFKAGAVAIGFLSHLILDEIWSIDLTHMRLKSSFGTAMKFSSDCHWATGLAYAVMGVTTLLVMNDPIWVDASATQKQVHEVARRIVDDFRQELKPADAPAASDQPAGTLR